MPDLNPKQQRFVDEYLIDLNATRAAIRAGYSDRTAEQQGSRLLGNAKVAAAVQEGRGRIADKLEVTQERIVAEFARMAFYDPSALGVEGITGPEDIAKLPEDVRRAIVGWSWDKAGNFTLKLADKNAALTNLGRHLGMFKDKLDVQVTDAAEVLSRALERARAPRG